MMTSRFELQIDYALHIESISMDNRPWFTRMLDWIFGNVYIKTYMVRYVFRGANITTKQLHTSDMIISTDATRLSWLVESVINGEAIVRSIAPITEWDINQFERWSGGSVYVFPSLKNMN